MTNLLVYYNNLQVLYTYKGRLYKYATAPPEMNRSIKMYIEYLIRQYF